MEGKRKVELLAPAGSPDAFYAAVNAGADAVYLAGAKFGARAYAQNFTTEELISCIRYGNLIGCRVYLTVNTLMKEEELAQLYDVLLPLYEAGLDGVIVQDLGAFRLIRECFPGLKLHASTQMTVCSVYGVRRLKEMGACRVVPARELSLTELAAIRSAVDIELETFVHGAMCYCYSGQCLFSSMLGERSGNRGRCAQPCRLPYSLKRNGKQGREQYLLSLKDLCTIEHLPELIGAGIDSFKIEGRMKRPEYTAGVTAVYRKYIDRYYELTAKYGAAAAEYFSVGKTDYERLTSLYIRSNVQDGYYFRHNGKEMVTADSPAYLAADENRLQELHDRYLSGKKKLPLTIRGRFREGEAATVTFSAGECTVSVTGQTVEHAQRQPVTLENIEKQLGKLGDTAFAVQSTDIALDEAVFYPLKQLNELRRLAVSGLEEKLLADIGKRTAAAKPDGPEVTPDTFPGKQKASGFAVSVMTKAQLEGLVQWLEKNPETELCTAYVAGDLLAEKTATGDIRINEGNRSLCQELSRRLSVFIALPYILRNDDSAYLDALYRLCDTPVFSGYLIRSVDGLGYSEGRTSNGILRSDASLYTWNRKAVLEAGTELDSCCLPYELKKAEQRRLVSRDTQWEKIVYGRIPMMVTANCVLRTDDRCMRGSREELALRDRYRKEFPVVRCCTHCTNIIYNSVPLVLFREAGEWKNDARLRLDFTVENPSEMWKILDIFISGKEPDFGEYTTGHEKRGVE